jgi:ribosomal protein S12 methylthiotransferase accessory factor YcaO
LDRLEYTYGEVFGRPCVQAVAYLRSDLVASSARVPSALELPDGAGTDVSLQVACHRAISEAIERWALLSFRAQGNVGGGSEIDGSSNGFAAFPGLFRRQTRAAALCESIERHCLMCWWEGLLRHQPLPDPVAGVRAIRIENPFSSHQMVVLWTSDAGRYSYSFGASSRLNQTIWRALVELARTRRLVQGLGEYYAGASADAALAKGTVYEQRILHFAGEAGIQQFLGRLERKVVAKQVLGPAVVLFDAAVPGEWDRYASVWRTIIQPPSRRYLSDEIDYFFW